MHDAIDDGRRGPRILENFAPSRERQVGRHDQAALLVDPGDEDKEKVRARAVERNVPKPGLPARPPALASQPGRRTGLPSGMSA
jgi:hypothetical protein